MRAVEHNGIPAGADHLRARLATYTAAFADVNLFDGQEHSYIEIGGFVGDQGMALQLMGLGNILGLWELYTPRTVFGKHITDEQAMQLAGNGMVSIRFKAPAATAAV